jgi:hypothetical protein
MRAGLRVALGFALPLLACDKRGISNDSAAARTAGAARETSWVPELGTVFAVPGDSDHAALVIVPAAPVPPSAFAVPLRLFRLAGDSVASVRATLVSGDTAECAEPALTLAGTVHEGWSVALTSNDVMPMRADSIESLSAADSGALAISIARLATKIPVASGSRFAGLPAVVLRAYRFSLVGRAVVFANVLRRMPQEAAPMEERTLIVAERAGETSEWVAAYTLRAEGTEESAEHFTLLAMLRAGARTLAVLEREQETGTRYELLERDATGGWRVVWSRTPAC